MVLTDLSGDDSYHEWRVETASVLSHVFENSAVLPALQLRFSASSCGCVKRVRFTWTGGEAGDSGSCETGISVQNDFGQIDACFPSWAFQSSDGAKSAAESRMQPLIVQLPASNPCHPAHSSDLPLARNAIRTASFDGHCR